MALLENNMKKELKYKIMPFYYGMEGRVKYHVKIKNYLFGFIPYSTYVCEWDEEIRDEMPKWFDNVEEAEEFLKGVYEIGENDVIIKLND